MDGLQWGICRQEMYFAFSADVTSRFINLVLR